MFVNPNINTSPYSMSRYGFAPSQFSPGGQSFLTPAQQYINSYQNAQVQQSSSGPNLLDFASNASKLNPSNSSGTGIMNGATSAINNFGTSLGFAPASSTGLVYSGIGPAALPWAQPGMLAPTSMAGQAGIAAPVGSLGTSATLSGTLGAAGIGAFAGSFLGKIGGNSTGGSIGGGIGAGIGMAVGGPIGAVIGGAIGGIGGGFFGNKTPATKSDEYRAMLTATGAPDSAGVYQGGKNSGEYSGFGKSVTNNLSSMLQRAHKELGINFNPKIQIGGGISTRYGGSHLNVGFNRDSDAEPIQGEQIFYNQNDPEEYKDAMKRSLVWAAKLSGVEDLAKVEKWYDDTTSTANTQNTYAVPFKSKQNFDSFMTKFKSQDTVNASTSTASTAA